jgi:ATP-dependent Clp protease ATP-binding subunit ClpC
VNGRVFERFTESARRVLVLAQEEARLLHHNFIGTEHILLGLLHEGEGVAARALNSLDVDLETVRQKVGEMIGPAGHSTVGSAPFTPRSKKVLELSLREAMQLRHGYIGTEHILLGLVREGEGVGAQVLVNLGAGLPTVRQRVIELLSGRDVPEPLGVQVVRRAGLPLGNPPLCPDCHNSLEGNLRYTSVAAKAAHPDRPDVEWTFVYCEMCGCALGLSAGGTAAGQA